MRAFAVSKRADLIAALSLEAFDGRIDPFMDCIQQMRPHPGQIETGDAFRRILEGSELISRKKEHVQDRIRSAASRRYTGRRKMRSGMSPAYCLPRSIP